MTGASAGCAVNKSNTNKKYDGELTVDVDRTQAELEAAIKAGRLMFHNVNGDVRILEDIDSLITVSDTKGDVFKSNQTIRVCDQIANDTAVLFNTRYLAPCRTMRRAESLSGTIFASSIRTSSLFALSRTSTPTA